MRRLAHLGSAVAGDSKSRGCCETLPAQSSPRTLPTQRRATDQGFTLLQVLQEHMLQVEMDMPYCLRDGSLRSLISSSSKLSTPKSPQAWVTTSDEPFESGIDISLKVFVTVVATRNTHLSHQLDDGRPARISVLSTRQRSVLGRR